MDELSIGNDVTMRAGASASLGRIDQYELLRELGGGGFGTVFLARDTVAGIEVAVKGLPPLVRNNREELENIRSNFALVSRLHDKHIAAALVLHPVKVVSYSERAIAEKLRVFEGDFLVVMEYAPGVTLSSWRKQFADGMVPAGKALDIVSQIAEALDYAHEQKIIHRDIKPANVMIETRGKAKGQGEERGGLVARVLDFGLAAEVRSSMGRVSQQVTDKSGTRPYMAPEQWLGKKQNAATDQYALAVLAYELLTGEVPFASAFETGDPVVMMNVVGRENPEISRELPRAMRQAFATAFAKDPAQRFVNCAAFVDALSGRTRTPSWPRWIATGAVALLAIAGVGGYVMWQRHEAEVAQIAETARQAELARRAELVRQEREKREAAEKAAAEAKRVAEAKAAEERRVAEENAAKQAAEAKRREAEAKRVAEEKEAAARQALANQRAERIRKLEKDAERKAGAGRWADCRSVIDKILLVDPSNPVAAKLKHQVVLHALSDETSDRTIELPNGQKLELVYCPPGSFEMGSPESENGHRPNEKLHRVTLTKGFWIGRYEVTVGQFKSILGADSIPVKYCKNDDLPVSLMFHWTQSFLENLPKQKNAFFCLPTEAQWEYACRAGRGGIWTNNLDDVAWYRGNSNKKTYPGGQKKANAWGLFDMLGNEWEWCSDYFADYYDDATDPVGPLSSDVKEHSRRGGSSYNDETICRPAYRDPCGEAGKAGLRVCLMPVEQRDVEQEEIISLFKGNQWKEAFERAARISSPNPELSFFMGAGYCSGAGVEKNLDKAVRHMTFAASNCVVRAFSSLGEMYERGLGLPVDVAQAEYWYRRGHVLADSESSYRLGRLLLTQQKPEGEEILKTAAEQGVPGAQYAYGELLFEGRYCKRDLKRAEYWLSQSAGQGNKFAQELLTVLQKYNDSGNGFRHEVRTVTLPGGATMDFVYCEPGTFLMGSPPDEPGRFDGETLHRVKLTKGFWIGKYPVTYEQWKSVMGAYPNGKNPKRDDLPVNYISWNDCQQFVSNCAPNGFSFSLPTEAQWEYACRAGTLTAYSFGNSLKGDFANCNGLFPCGTTEIGRNRGKASPVGEYGTNPWGIADMHGNVKEWCLDVPRLVENSELTVDPVGQPYEWKQGCFTERVLRGGSYSDGARYCRSACRGQGYQQIGSGGFRIVAYSLDQIKDANKR